MTDDTPDDASAGDDASPPEVPVEQLELLWLAVESGYFRVPREASITQVADRAGLSDVEASRRLRRAIENVLRNSEFFRERTTRRGGGRRPVEPRQ